MTSQKAADRLDVLDPQTSTLERLAALATAVLGEHANDADLCAVCGCAWPCDRVLLADHNLSVL